VRKGEEGWCRERVSDKGERVLKKVSTRGCSLERLSTSSNRW